jgi:nucleoid-associated protein YgaU
MKIKTIWAAAAFLTIGGFAGFFSLRPLPVSKPEVVAVVVAPAVKPPTPVAEVKKPEPQTTVSAVSNTVKIGVAPKPVAPSFDTVRVEPNGDAIIAGRAAPLTQVFAKLGDAVVASATSNADGSFVMIPAKPLPPGAATLSLETKADGVSQVSATTVAIAVKLQETPTVAIVGANQPTKVLQAPKPTTSVSLDAVDYDVAGNIVFSGRAKPDSVVRLYVDNAIAGEIKSDASGKWIYSGATNVLAGTHSLRADEISSDGSVASRVELPFLREAPETVVAVTPDPTIATSTATQVEAPEPTRIVIQPGNNLWTLSRQIYGAGRRYTVIYEANKDQIKNPRLIYPGQIITAPLAEAKQP